MGYAEPVLSLTDLANTRITAERLLLLQEITAALSKSLTLREVAEIIIKQGLAALGAYAGTVALVEPVTQKIEVIQSVGYSANIKEIWHGFNYESQAPLATAIKRSEAVWISSPRELRAFYPSLTGKSETYSERSKAWAALPLLVEDRNLGGIGLSFSTEYNFLPVDKSYMITLARQCAQAIDRALLFEKQQKSLAEAENARRDQTFLSQASLTLCSSLDYMTTLRNITEVIVPVLADFCTIDLLNDDGTLDRLHANSKDPLRIGEAQALIKGYPFRPDSPHGIAKAIRARKPDFVPQITDSLLKEHATDDEHFQLLLKNNLKSYMVVPLILHELVMGTISLMLDHTSSRSYKSSDLQLVQDLAVWIAMSIENARLYEAAQLARQQTARLQNIAASLSAAVNMQQVGNIISDQVGQSLRANMPTIIMVDETGQAAEILFGSGYSPEIISQWQNTPLDTRAPIFEAIRTGSTILVENIEAARQRFPVLLTVNQQYKLQHQAWACFPLMLEGKKVIGALGLTFDEPQHFSQDELDFMSIVCDYCAQALDRVRMYETERKIRQEAELSQKRLTFLTKASDILTQSLEYQTTLQTVVEMTVPALADWCSLYLLKDEATSPTGYADELTLAAITHRDPKTLKMMRQFRERYPLIVSDKSNQQIAEVISTGRSTILPELDNSLPAGYLPSGDYEAGEPANLNDLRKLALAVAMLVPVKSPGKILGVLTLARAVDGAFFGPADLELAEELALRAGQALTNARLVQSLKTALNERNTFLNVAAHELKTPITTLKGYTQLMLRQIKRPTGLELQRVGQYLKTIELQSEKLNRLIGQLLDISRLENGNLVLKTEMTAVEALVTEVIEAARMRSDSHNLVIQNNLPPDFKLLLDPMRFEQVLTNLIDNALKFSPDGGEVKVELSLAKVSDRTALAPTAKFDSRTGKRFRRVLCLSVSDQGIGIAREKREHIFEKFYQAHQDHHMSGMGLGLFITRQIVQLHQGQIEAQFPAEGGTRFLIQLPVEQALVA